VLAAIGAFLSGVGSVLGAWIAIRAVRRRMTKECEERFALFKEGIGIGEQHDRLDS
jgi:hypothetical protein